MSNGKLKKLYDTAVYKRDFLQHVVLRNHPLSYEIKKGENSEKPIRIIGMIRMRNEELLLQDTLDHLSQFVDGIVIYDDASTDRSVLIAREHPSVLEVISSKEWIGGQRAWEETASRRLLLHRAKKYHPEWIFYADADERFEGDIREFLLNECPSDVDAIRISLFDAYITPEDKRDYKLGETLYNFRKFFGLEQRNIIMIWRNKAGVRYSHHDSREPQGIKGKVVVKFYCQHYGKSLSIQHWEDTCEYYATNFPAYSEKWNNRRGKAVHTKSDFGTKLYEWDKVKKNGALIN